MCIRDRVARGSTIAVSIVAAVEPGGFAQLPSIWYVEKIVAGPAARGGIDLDDTIADNLRRIAFARDARVQDLTVAIRSLWRGRSRMATVRSWTRASLAKAIRLRLSAIGSSRSMPPRAAGPW